MKNTSRFEARLDSEQKLYLERAAQLAGYSTLTQFILEAARAKAELIFEKHQQLVTSTEDAIKLQEVLINPPKANARMKNAYRRFKQK